MSSSVNRISLLKMPASDRFIDGSSPAFPTNFPRVFNGSRHGAWPATLQSPLVVAEQVFEIGIGFVLQLFDLRPASRWLARSFPGSRMSPSATWLGNVIHSHKKVVQCKSPGPVRGLLRFQNVSAASH